MSPDELLRRLAQTLKQEIAPAVGEAYPKTQAYMASVVLDKLSQQLALAEAHAAAGRADVAALAHDLRELLGGSPLPAALGHTLAGLGGAPNKHGLNALVAALYAAQAELDTEVFRQSLARIRQTLRLGLDRELVYAA